MHSDQYCDLRLPEARARVREDKGLVSGLAYVPEEHLVEETGERY